MFLNHLYGDIDEPELKIIDVFVCKLRKKLQDENYIGAVWGRDLRAEGSGCTAGRASQGSQRVRSKQKPNGIVANNTRKGRERSRPFCTRGILRRNAKSPNMRSNTALAHFL